MLTRTPRLYGKTLKHCISVFLVTLCIFEVLLPVLVLLERHCVQRMQAIFIDSNDNGLAPVLVNFKRNVLFTVHNVAVLASRDNCPLLSPLSMELPFSVGMQSIFSYVVDFFYGLKKCKVL